MAQVSPEGKCKLLPPAQSTQLPALTGDAGRQADGPHGSFTTSSVWGPPPFPALTRVPAKAPRLVNMTEMREGRHGVRLAQAQIRRQRRCGRGCRGPWCCCFPTCCSRGWTRLHTLPLEFTGRHVATRTLSRVAIHKHPRSADTPLGAGFSAPGIAGPWGVPSASCSHGLRAPPRARRALLHVWVPGRASHLPFPPPGSNRTNALFSKAAVPPAARLQLSSRGVFSLPPERLAGCMEPGSARGRPVAYSTLRVWAASLGSERTSERGGRGAAPAGPHREGASIRKRALVSTFL